MQAFHRKQPFAPAMLSYSEKRALAQSSVYIDVGGNESIYPILQKLLQVLCPREQIHCKREPDFKNIDTYVMFYLCPYDVEEAPLLIQAIHYAQSLLKSRQLKPEAHILIILYRDLKVAFPERKLQREKVMSAMITEKILFEEASIDQERIQITHEFGINNLQDSLQQLTGHYFYFELMP